MDLWVVAAAAGAGYVAKNLQNLSLDKKESSGAPSFKYSANVQSESRNLQQQLRDKTCPFRRLARKKAEADALLENHMGVNSDQLINRHSEAGGLASSSDDALQKNEFPEDYNLCRISKLPSNFSTEEELEFEDGEIRNFPRVNRGKLIRNRKRSENLIRPLIPLGSCVDAQICREHERDEETINVLIPSMSAARAILITNGTRIFNRSNSASSFEQFEGGEEVKRENVDYIKANSVTLGSASLQGHDGMLLFITGMIIGISSATAASKNIVDKLNKQLKQTQNLVEDLHEELDMKDMVTVKELTEEGYLRSGGSNTPFSNPSDVKVNCLPNFDKSTELMSKIEAELEAELEMLERNMMESKLEQISNVVELGPDFEPDIVQGDLKPVTGIQVHGDSFESKNETTDTTPNNNYYSQPPNYAVCPWELSLRLHELIESRLEARVKELETAFGNTENGFQLQKGYSYSETRSSSSSPYTSVFINEGDEYKNLNRISSRGEYKDEEKEDEEFIGTAGEQGAIWEKHTWSGFMSDEDCRDEDDGCDENETLLLKRIIERTKSGSSVVFELLRSSESHVMA